MFEQLNERATKVMGLAHEEAARYHSPYVGTEHILLSVASEGSGIAANILKGFGIDLAWIRPAVEKLAPVWADPAADPAALPQTPRAKKVIECAFEEARGMNHSQVGPEHLLIGMLRVRESVAAMVLTQFGLSVESVRQAVLDLVGLKTKVQPTPPARRQPTAAPPDDTLLPTRFAEAWVSIIIGAILLYMMPNTPRLLLHFAHLAEEPMPMTDGTPYIQSRLVFPDAAVSVFAVVLIVSGLIFLLLPKRPMLVVVLGLTVAAVFMNLTAIVVEWDQGLQLLCALAVALGGYQCFSLIGEVGRARTSATYASHV